MDTLQAFAMGEANKGKELKVFDWIKAAELIKANPQATIRAGLASDWEYTGGTIWEDGEKQDDYTYLASTWATPEIEIDGETFDCFKMASETPNWDADTKFPPEFWEVLNKE
jgi:hypothetical protein